MRGRSITKRGILGILEIPPTKGWRSTKNGDWSQNEVREKEKNKWFDEGEKYFESGLTRSRAVIAQGKRMPG